MALVFTRTLWNYRGFIIGNVKREFQSKYRNSLLGAAWNVLNPLAMIIVYTVIFSQVMKAKLPGVDDAFAYSIYLCSGVLTWGFFSEIVSRGQNVFLEQANLIKKVSFPRVCLPITVVLNALLNFGIVFGLFTVFLLVTNEFPGLAFISLLPVLIVLIIFSIGLGITLGILNVFFRDVGHFFGIVLQFWFWLTPIVYSVSILPTSLQKYIHLNPLFGVITSFQTILVKHEQPDWQSLLPALTVGVLLCLIGMRLFRKYSGEMVDEL
ncbi:ABC transporter permease [Rahnella sp. PD12R]|uniref:ABC transporter permease n=1 Tax=Rahnella sp. PD12R TaxID=2855688 RepID=UPI001C44F899|nr:ABC transporter permease [Rahnella sp. PD12R]MBV6821299.1 ABC transporter permease [Rahnella sp. PD12R]